MQEPTDSGRGSCSSRCGCGWRRSRCCGRCSGCWTKNRHFISIFEGGMHAPKERLVKKQANPHASILARETYWETQKHN